MHCAVVLFTRDLRVHDNPALAYAIREAERVLPLFVLDDELLAASERRAGLLGAALHDSTVPSETLAPDSSSGAARSSRRR